MAARCVLSVVILPVTTQQSLGYSWASCLSWDLSGKPVRRCRAQKILASRVIVVVNMQSDGGEGFWHVLGRRTLSHHLWASTYADPHSATHYCMLLFSLSYGVIILCWNTDTHTHTPFVQDYPGKPVPDKTNLDFTEARDSEWQWHQLGHMQVCSSLQTDNHASTPLPLRWNS